MECNSLLLLAMMILDRKEKSAMLDVVGRLRILDSSGVRFGIAWSYIGGCQEDVLALFER